MKRTMFLLSVACVALVCIAALSIVSSPAHASAKVSTSTEIHNSEKKIATDLHFYLTTSENKRLGPPYMVCFESYSVKTTPPLGVAPTYTPKVDGVGCVYAVVVDYSDITVPYCTTVRIDVEATLSKQNSLVVDSLRFTYPDRPPKKASPAFGFDYWPPHPIRVKAGTNHSTNLRFRNFESPLGALVDSTDSLTLCNIRIFRDTVWTAPENWTDSLGMPVGVIPGPVVLGPGDSLDIPLSVPTPITPRRDPPSYIYAYAMKQYKTDTLEVRFFQNGHEETLVLDEGLPALGTWGILVLALVVATTAALLVRRRKALPTQ